ncbi:MAG: permease prefix domain 1-containing protein [Defluviitaleaceae bacterium]|nr:permease prefix domain 1-containing protein [Defluviitaleaceae bacterium]
MNDRRIIDFVNDLFTGVKQTDKVIEQKEELQAHLTERIKDYMGKGAAFDDAFDMARNDIGDVSELTAGFEKVESRSTAKAAISSGGDWCCESEEWFDDDDEDWFREGNWKFVALTPFIFLGLGFMFGWWAWAWMIIPISAILTTPMESNYKIIALSPFVFLTLGFMFGWWAWGWMVIPISGILFGIPGSIRKSAKQEEPVLHEPKEHKLQ